MNATSHYIDVMKPKVVEVSKRSVCVYNISDLHADPEINKRWVLEHCKPIQHSVNKESFENNTSKGISNCFNILIVPGDVGSNLTRIKIIFNILVTAFDLVVYTPGNHEAWCSSVSNGGNDPQDSLQKLSQVIAVAVEAGVCLQPVKIVCTSTDEPPILEENKTPAKRRRSNVVIIPLYSWYHCGFDEEPTPTIPPELFSPSADEFEKRWADFSLCRWPQSLVSKSDFSDLRRNNEILAQHFGRINEPLLDTYFSSSPNINSDSVFPKPLSERAEHENKVTEAPVSFHVDRATDFVITFSHFVPRQELTPEKRFLLESQLPKVIGSRLLESQIRRVMPDLHLFGHTHIPIDMSLGGVRYVQWPLGYHREHSEQCRLVYEHGPLLVFCSHPECVWAGQGSEGEYTRQTEVCKAATWSVYYEANARDPLNLTLASWVRKRWLGIKQSSEI